MAECRLMRDPDSEFVDEVLAHGVVPGQLVALVVTPTLGLGLAVEDRSYAFAGSIAQAIGVVGRLEQTVRPRWVVWSGATSVGLVQHGLRIATCWDLAAVHRLRHGGWRSDPARVWALSHDLAGETIPAAVRTDAPDLFSQFSDEWDGIEVPVRPDGHLAPAWAAGAWADTVDRAAVWASLALQVAALHSSTLTTSDHPDRYAATARAESATELLCAEMAVEGLPLDRDVATALIGAVVGARPTSESDAAAGRAARDAEVLRHLPDHARSGVLPDLRSPGQVKSLLRSVGIEVPDTRAWRLEPLRDAHPIVPALLKWRKSERVSTTYGYSWLDEHVGADHRLRGTWSSSDGAAGRMTASAGLHNLPGEMRDAVIAEPGHVFVRADLGQIEPRVLAAVSGDAVLARATADEDMYQPIAERLAVDRATAKVAVLGAMYGQTTGHGATALRGLRANYPVAMTYLEDADRSGQVGRELRTYGGRRIRMDKLNVDGLTDSQARSRSAGQGRYARNALVQGAAAELFKLWAVTVRARGRAMDAHIVLCLHDELLVHVPVDSGADCVRLLDDSLQEAVRRWAPDAGVRFLADISVVSRWSDAKD